MTKRAASIIIVLYIIVLLPTKGFGGWTAASEIAASRIAESNELNNAPELTISDCEESPAHTALCASLTRKGFVITSSGGKYSVLIRHDIKKNFIWECPYQRYEITFKVLDSRDRIVLSDVASSKEAAASLTQLSLQVFILIAFAIFLYIIIYKLSLYRSKAAWLVCIFIWLAFLFIEAQSCMPLLSF